MSREQIGLNGDSGAGGGPLKLDNPPATSSDYNFGLKLSSIAGYPESRVKDSTGKTVPDDESIPVSGKVYSIDLMASKLGPVVTGIRESGTSQVIMPAGTFVDKPERTVQALVGQNNIRRFANVYKEQGSNFDDTVSVLSEQYYQHVDKKTQDRADRAQYRKDNVYTPIKKFASGVANTNLGIVKRFQGLTKGKTEAGQEQSKAAAEAAAEVLRSQREAGAAFGIEKRRKQAAAEAEAEAQAVAQAEAEAAAQAEAEAEAQAVAQAEAEAEAQARAAAEAQARAAAEAQAQADNRFGEGLRQGLKKGFSKGLGGGSKKNRKTSKRRGGKKSNKSTKVNKKSTRISKRRRG